VQPTLSPTAGDAKAVFERTESNRRILRATMRRLLDVRQDSERARTRSGDLRREVRAGLDQLLAGIATGKQIRPVEVRRRETVRPRPRPGPEDRLDRLRQDLHATYAATRDPHARAELLRSYDGFARSLALKFRHREAMDDLVQVARMGLLHAIDRFDPALGRPFPLFARITITGELKRHLRDRTWSMRVPRSLQEDYLSVMRAVDELTAETSDSPSMEAVAERCRMPIERVLEATELRVSQRPLSFDAPPAFGSDNPLLEVGREDGGYLDLENRQLLAQLLARLPERDRRIVELRFIQEMTQSEIAAEVGVSQMCVSRVLARTLGRLRLWARTAAG
jgi:RNA polymerase sigma-B factor